MIMRSCGGGLLNVTASDEIQRIDGNLMPSVNFPRLPGPSGGEREGPLLKHSAAQLMFWPIRCLFLASRSTTVQSTVNVAGSVVLTIFKICCCDKYLRPKSADTLQRYVRYLQMGNGVKQRMWGSLTRLFWSPSCAQ